MAIKNYIEREIGIRELYTGEAKCEQIGDMIFFPRKEDPNFYTRFAKKICSECPILDVCGSYAIQNLVHGVWGGMTARQREIFRGKYNIVPKEVEVA